MDLTDIEHERKFLVNDPSIIGSDDEGTSIVQGYFGTAPGYAARVRIYPTLGIYQYNIKGPRDGISRIEKEWNLEPEQAEIMFAACGDVVIDKTRYGIVGPDGAGWDVDLFHGANQGLLLAELELKHPDQTFKVPAWCGEEVTSDPRYYNDYLAHHPFTLWPT